MRCIRVRREAGAVRLELDHYEPPSPGPGQIQVRWRASSLNYHDYAVITGGLPTVDGRIPMSDGAGEIVAVGPGAGHQWAVGDRVMSVFFPNWIDGRPDIDGTMSMSGDSVDGCACEVSTLEASAVTRMPAGYSFAEAATLPCAALTAWRAIVEVCRVRAGDRVLVQGSGGMSMFALQFAKAAGATVYATSSSHTKLARLRELGADQVINYREDRQWGASAYALAGNGVEHVVDSGGGNTIAQSMAACGVGATAVLVGVLGGFEASIAIQRAIAKQLRFQAVAVGSRQMQLDMLRAIEANGIRPVLDRHFPLAELAEAFAYQASNRHFGKIVVEI